VALKPETRLYATQAWAQRRNIPLPAEPDAAVRALYDCDRSACKPYGYTHPAIAAWWTKRKPAPARLAALCRGADILILRADVSLPWECRDVWVLGRAEFERNGAAEIFASSGGWRIDWALPRLGRRPWTLSGNGG
jgi:competence protein ComEC